VSQDYTKLQYEMFRGGTEGREMERSACFVEEQAWKEKGKDKRGQLHVSWSVHLYGHALGLAIAVCPAFPSNSISDYFPG